MKKTNIIKLGFLCVTLAVTVLLGSCAKKNAKNLPVLNLTLLLSSNYSPILHLNAEGGIAEEHGVYPVLEYTTGLESVLAGKSDGRLNALQQSIIAGGNGSDIVIFAGTMGGGLLLFANKNVAEEAKNPATWKGKTIGVFAGATDECVIRSSLKEKYGIGYDEVTYKYFENDEAIIAACKHGDVDIISPYYALREVAEASGLVQIGELVDLSPDFACCRQTANGAKLRADRASFVNWTKGLIYSWKYFNTNEKGTVKVIKKVTSQDDQWVYEHIYDPDGTGHITFIPDPYYNGCAPQYDVLLELGFIERENARPFADYFDISIYADALKAVIAENPGDQFYKDMWTYFVNHNNTYPDFEKLYPKTL